MASSQFRPHTQKPGRFRCPYWNQGIFGQHTNTKSISTTLTKTKSIDPHTKNKSFSPRTQNQVNFDSDIKPSQIWFPTQKSSPPTQKPSQLGSLNIPPKSRIVSIPALIGVGIITWLLYGWSNWPWLSCEGRHPRYTSQFRGQHEYYITTVWIIARRGSFSCFMLPTFRLLFFRCHSCRDVCWLLVRFKAHSLIAYILRVFRVEYSSTLPYSCLLYTSPSPRD